MIAGLIPQADLIDRKKLFPLIRKSIFGGRLLQSQVTGINHILDAWDDSPLDDLRWLAYMLGTTFHETGGRMQPIKEMGGRAYLTRQYDILGRRPEVARQMGNTEPGDGIKYCGRGYVQLTWRTNYLRCGREIGIELVSQPDLAMDPDIAARIMFEGMTRHDILVEEQTGPGTYTFTGRALEDYFNDTVEDWVSARRIINGLDHAQMIGETAQDFYAALDYTKGSSA